MRLPILQALHLVASEHFSGDMDAAANATGRHFGFALDDLGRLTDEQAVYAMAAMYRGEISHDAMSIMDQFPV